ncbi:urea transporter [Gordonia neofelifaecis]|uniref:Putative urea transporter n=1 Tax=Gordonia neofelifaecis NRRL B-59395 TaxID=644548 RepID=F1YNE5_9ACTN|nr:urea transporter [Gordonia neofelifaecis]EGD53856.1 putative urea transporter [Gordonia neofelifaecis NRRL B-59395]
MTETRSEAVRPFGTPRDAAATALHGVGQIYFQPSVWCGLFILAAFCVADWRMALLGVIGLAASTAAGVALRDRLPGSPDGTALRAGMHGFCGILVGAAAFTMLGAGWAGVIATAIGGLLCGPITVGFVALFAARGFAQFALPATTAPFCLVAQGIHYTTEPFQHEVSELSEVHGDLVQISVHAALTGISQVVLIDSPVAGLLILIGLTIANWKVGVAAILGSAASAGFAWLIGEAPLDDYHGLDSYSSVLVAIAMACVFLSGKWSPWVMALIGAVLAAALEQLLLETEVPLFTWPYVLVTWLLLIVARYVPALARPPV